MNIHTISRSVSFVPCWKYSQLLFISYFPLCSSLVSHSVKVCTCCFIFCRCPPPRTHFFVGRHSLLVILSAGMTSILHFVHWWNCKCEVPSINTAGSGYSARKAEHMRGSCCPWTSPCCFRSQVRVSIHLVHDFLGGSRPGCSGGIFMRLVSS
jgi:hypothetical protein